MEGANFLDLRASLEESILEAHRDEESLIVTFEVGQNFNHPVDHSCSESWSDIVSLETIGRVVCLFKVSEVLVNIQA